MSEQVACIRLRREIEEPVIKGDVAYYFMASLAKLDPFIFLKDFDELTIPNDISGVILLKNIRAVVLFSENAFGDIGIRRKRGQVI